ncbi:MAG: glycosyltransferase [Saprospiraceae bacterium]|nr:glycosyltransferase [Saprospiraceae bacterium]
MRNPRAFRIENLIRSRYSDQEYLVITSRFANEKNINEKNIYRLGISRNIQSLRRQQLKKYFLLRFLHRLIWPDDKILYNIWSLIYYILFLRKRDDHIYTVSNPFSSHFIGYFLKRFLKHVWTIDVGDLFYLPDQSASYFKKCNLYFERKVTSTCDHLLVNADSMRAYFADKYKLDRNKIQVIPNGNRLDFPKMNRSKSKTLQLTFIGNTYESLRDGLAEIDIFLRLYNEHPELNMNIQLLGMMYQPLLQKINACQTWIQTSVCNSDEKLLEAYAKTDILLNFANKNYPGIPSKLEEYIASGIPVIHFCWQANDPGSIFLKQSNHPFLEFVIGQTPVLELKIYLDKFKD